MQIRGKALTIDVPNPNGDVYPREMIEKELERIAPLIEQKALLGGTQDGSVLCRGGS